MVRLSFTRCIWVLMLGVVSFAASAAEAEPAFEKSWWNDTPWVQPDRGFNWYPDPLSQTPVDKKMEERPSPKKIYDMTNMDDVRGELKRLRDTAVLNPTEDNVHEYLRAQAWAMDKASVFADVSRRVVWTSPEVNYNNRSPVANFARNFMNQA